MSTPPGFYTDPLDLFACMDYSRTPEIPTDPRERTLFLLRCESLGLSGDEGLAYGVGQLVAGEADLEDGYYVLQRTMHQPGGRYWHSPYTVLPLPCSLAEWHGQWERLNFCDYSTFVGNPEGEFHTLYAQRFFYIGMNDTEERRDWLADLVYQELELIKEYGSIQELENQRKEALRVCAPSFCGFQQAQPCLGTVGPKDFHLPPSTVSAGVGEEQEASQTTLLWCPREIPVCEEFSGCVTPGLAEPESGCCHFKGLAEAEASPSEIPVCMESSGCVTPGLAEPESGCCHFKGLAEAEASPSENPVCLEFSGCVAPVLAEPESGCCHFKGLAEAEASPSENPVCLEFSGCVTPGLAEPESGCCHFKGLAEAEASLSENPVCLEFSGCVTPVLVEPESGCCHFKGLAEAEAFPSEIPVCMEFSGCVTPGLAEPESGCCHFKGLAEAEASPSEIPNCVEPGAAQFEKNSKEGRDEDSPLPELLLAGEDQEQDQEESIAQDSPMSIRAVSSGNGVRGTRKAQRVTRAVVPETPSGRQQGQRITPQRNKTLVSPRAVPTISPRWRGPPLCNVTGTGALREVGWNLELKKIQGDKHLSNTLWGSLVIGVT
ncbi:uncharacterized protein LOC100488381 [Xenopus tropicalis]|uniref:Uncharacterized protein LOC100488381 n=1 Tax=Xenopus tropicalis TaxID=8364 RepID=A0A1B8XVT9_XENTR|nr:uncharacterized protein LOC100488381 [Xenopus tropicalis]|eukprot:XP_012810510.1 PREDICTED: uncharacterized protein LOC100488381 [Xenopus tropicalis]